MKNGPKGSIGRKLSQAKARHEASKNAVAKYTCGHCGHTFEIEEGIDLNNITGAVNTFCPECNKDIHKPIEPAGK